MSVTLCAAAVALELLHVVTDRALWSGSSYDLLPSAVLVVPLAAMWRTYLDGRRPVRQLDVALATTCAAVCVWAAVTLGRPAVELAAATASEEVVWRVGVTGAVYLALLRFGRRRASGVAVVSSSVAFALLPGHLAQLDAYSAAALLTAFVTMGLLWAVLVWETGTLLSAVSSHVTLNLMLAAVNAGVAPWWAHRAATAVIVTAVAVALTHATRKQTSAIARRVWPAAAAAHSQT